MSKELKKATAPVIVCVFLSALTVFLLSPSSIVSKFIRVDLSYLIVPVIAFLVIRLGRKLVNIFMPGLSGRLLSCGLSGASAAVFLVAFLNWVRQVSQTEMQVSSIIDSIIGYSILFITGLTIYIISRILDKEESSRWASPITGTAALLIIGFSTYASLNTITETWELASSVGLVVLAGFVASAVSSLAGYGEMVRNRYVADISQLISRSGFWMFVLGALMFSYIALIRPSIADSFAYTPLIEWGIICLVALWLCRWVRLSVKEKSVQLEISKVEKHSQQIQEMVDAQLNYLGTMQEAFVEKGRRPRLLVSLINILLENGWDRDRISEVLTPLIDYEEIKMPRYDLIRGQSRIQNRGETIRRQILTDIITAIVEQSGIPLDKTEVKHEQ
jgi:hypothetical protein